MFEKYNRQIKHIDFTEEQLAIKEELIKKTKQDLAQSKIALWGTPGSAFYGLKKPGKFKCLKYISDQYNVCPDLMETIQNLVIKKDKDNNMEKLKEQYMNPRFDYKIWCNSADDRIPHKIYPVPSGRWEKDFDWTRPKDKPRSKHNKWEVKTHHCPEADGNLKIGGITYSMYGGAWQRRVGQRKWYPSVALSRQSSLGTKFDPDLVSVLKKDELIKACEHYTCVPYKSSWNRKQLWQHLMKYA